MKFVLVLFTFFAISSSLPTNKYDGAGEFGDFFEGDMILNSEQRLYLQKGSAKNGLINEKYRWKNNIVPYTINQFHFTQEQKDYIRKGLDVLESVTCLKFVERTKETDYIIVEGSGSGCFSDVGYKGYSQIVNLAPNDLEIGCFRLGTIMHEFIHSLGFYHMQSTSTRDEYVNVIWENITPGYEHNFNKYSSAVVSEFGEKYDYNSVMHYPEYAFSKNGEKTIIPHDPNASIGQRTHLSEIDIAKINAMYKC